MDPAPADSVPAVAAKVSALAAAVLAGEDPEAADRVVAVRAAVVLADPVALAEVAVQRAVYQEELVVPRLAQWCRHLRRWFPRADRRESPRSSKTISVRA